MISCIGLFIRTRVSGSLKTFFLLIILPVIFFLVFYFDYYYNDYYILLLYFRSLLCTLIVSNIVLTNIFFYLHIYDLHLHSAYHHTTHFHQTNIDISLICTLMSVLMLISVLHEHVLVNNMWSVTIHCLLRWLFYDNFFRSEIDFPTVWLSFFKAFIRVHLRIILLLFCSSCKYIVVKFKRIWVNCHFQPNWRI